MLPFRIGQGYDCHALVPNRKLMLGGVHIPYERGLAGHSDADVLLHAIIDALLGAAALGDIGTHFPDTDEKYRGADSRVLLHHTAEILLQMGFQIDNIDATVIAQQPRLAPYILAMRETIAKDLCLDVSRVSVKAKTNERLGYLGRGEAIEAQAVALIYQTQA